MILVSSDVENPQTEQRVACCSSGEGLGEIELTKVLSQVILSIDAGNFSDAPIRL